MAKSVFYLVLAHICFWVWSNQLDNIYSYSFCIRNHLSKIMLKMLDVIHKLGGAVEVFMLLPWPYNVACILLDNLYKISCRSFS